MIPAFVLVHGNAHGSWCWQTLTPMLGAPALAVDLPGRADRPAPPPPARIHHFADSVLEDIDRAGHERLVLVGHSLAGLTIPLVAARLRDRVDHIVLVSAVVPDRGGDSMIGAPLLLRPLLRAAARREPAMTERARRMSSRRLCNDMTDEQAAFVEERLCTELLSVAVEPAQVTMRDVAEIPATYVVCRRDRAISPARQRKMARRLGPMSRIVELDAGHDVMVSNPAALAEVLNSVL